MFKICLFTSLFFLAACGNPYFFQPSSDADNPVFWMHGLPTISQKTDQVKISANLSSAGDGILKLNLVVENLGEQPYTFDPAELRVVGFNSRGEGRHFRVFSAHGFQRFQENRSLLIAGAAAAVATGAVLAIDQSADGSTNQTQTFDNQNFWLNGSPVIVVGSPQAAAVPTYLQKHTIFQKEKLIGLVKIRLNRVYGQRIRVDLPVGGEKLVFDFGARTLVR